MNAKEKMKALIESKKTSGEKSKYNKTNAKNNQKNMRKGPKIYNN